jgi:hypothetical protein
MANQSQFPAQRKFEELFQQLRAEQKEKQDKLRKEFEDLREERKINLQASSLVLSLLALVVSIAFGLWNARIAYRSLAAARRGFVAVRVGEGPSTDPNQIKFEIRAIPPNPALHIRVEAACGTYVENGRQPDQALGQLGFYEKDLTLAPGDTRPYQCNAGSSEGLHAPHGIIQHAIRGRIQYRDLAGNEYFTDFCFKRPDPLEVVATTDFLACPNLNEAD